MTDPAIVQLMHTIDYKAHLQEALDSAVFDELSEHYREEIVEAAGDAALALAHAATGDPQGVAELRIVKARLALWTFAAAEHTRRAILESLRKWLVEAVQAAVAIGAPLIEAGLRALAESGMNALA